VLVNNAANVSIAASVFAKKLRRDKTVYDFLPDGRVAGKGEG
jgi:hypothetical protein